MKSLYFLCIIFLVMCEPRTYAQTEITMCHTSNSATASFAQLANDPDFRNAHELASYKHIEANGKSFTYDTPDGKKSTAYLIKANGNSHKYLFVIHEWWGLNDYIKSEAEKLYEELDDVNVIALDLYDGQVATTPDAAGKLMQSVKEDRAQAIINGAIKAAGKDAEIATIGWCFGGGWSLQSTILASKEAAGCVMYYGMPVDNMDEIKKIDADVLGIFAGKDQWITPEIARTFEKNMKEAGKDITVKIFDANHAFANPSSDAYNSKAAQEANKMALAFLKKHLD